MNSFKNTNFAARHTILKYPILWLAANFQVGAVIGSIRYIPSILKYDVPDRLINS